MRKHKNSIVIVVVYLRGSFVVGATSSYYCSVSQEEVVRKPLNFKMFILSMTFARERKTDSIGK